jgi:hypothetical protein
LATVGKIATWGFVELFSMFEDLILDLYRIYYWAHPANLIKQDSELRNLWKHRSVDDDSLKAWEAAFSPRLDAWQRKKAYERLDEIFLAFFRVTGLRSASVSKAGPEEWSRTLRLVALMRHSIVHGVAVVSEELVEAARAAQPYHLALEFRVGEPLEINIDELSRLELFAEQLLTAVNLSMVEAAS